VTLAALNDKLAATGLEYDRTWLNLWRETNEATGIAIDDALARETDPFEGTAIADVAATLPDNATLVVGNSMPVRDLDSFVRGDARPIRIVANRGANGIDGVVSSALGAAAVANGPVVLVVGDLSFYHDLNGLLAARRFAIDATIVVLNNDGGGIFSFLPQAEQLDECLFESLFGTPIGLDIAAASRLYGATFTRPCDRTAFRREIRRAIDSSGLSIVEYVTDRARNVTQHRAVWTAVTGALRRRNALTY
jgi:2-succinyl-5-enolpyruvyl-6-hydroxy-3-cyclohexene-1-carboxylate synthase